MWLFLVYHACTLHICFYYLSDSGDCVFGWGSVSVTCVSVTYVCNVHVQAAYVVSELFNSLSVHTLCELNAYCCIVHNVSDGTLSFYFQSYETSIMAVILAIIYLYCPSDVAVFHCLLHFGLPAGFVCL